MSASQTQILYESEDHKYIWLGADEKEEKGVIRTNQFLIIHKGRGILLDPGGLHLFSRVVSAVSQHISMDNIDAIFYSHQDPDVSSGIALWLGICDARIYISHLWIRFLPHFGLFDSNRIIPLSEEKINLDLGGYGFKVVPSHFMHSVGCYSLFDPESSILFTGDIGAADMAYDGDTLFADDFEKHKGTLVGFHKRYMNSRKVCARWVSLIRPLEPALIAPQHGPLFRKESLRTFLSWLENLECGTDLLDTLYGRG
jgi:flavorubredoxin